jgi:threonine dehydrogenase-like Zn-dependent dehydrogenase
VVIAGVCTHPDPYVPLRAVLKELTLAFAVYYTRREFFSVVDALARGVIDPAPFVTDKVGLAGANDAFRALTEAKEQRKILVVPELG